MPSTESQPLKKTFCPAGRRETKIKRIISTVKKKIILKQMKHFDMQNNTIQKQKEHFLMWEENNPKAMEHFDIKETKRIQKQ